MLVTGISAVSVTVLHRLWTLDMGFSVGNSNISKVFQIFLPENEHSFAHVAV